MNERMKAVRMHLNLSQKAFGERLGISNAEISKIETGDRNLTPQLALLITQQFGVNERWLDTGEGEMFITDPDALMRLDHAQYLFKTLRPEFQDFALEMIRGLTKLDEK